MRDCLVQQCVLEHASSSLRAAEGAANVFPLPSMTPALARAYTLAVAQQPGAAATDVTVVLDGSRVVEHGPPKLWAAGVAQRVTSGHLQLGILRITRTGMAAPFSASSRSSCRPTPAAEELSPQGASRTPLPGPLSKILSRPLKVGISADPGGCSYMEDMSLVHAPTGSGFAFCGVFDGHGGTFAARHCKENLHFNVMASPAFGRGDVRTALLDGFRKTEADLIGEQSAASATFGSALGVAAASSASTSGPGGRQSGEGARAEGDLDAMPPTGCCGCTALVVLLHSDSMHIAWLGDCRAVLCSAGECRELTVDHSLLDPKERARALADGGMVEGNRLGGFLEVARALGDFDSAQGRKPDGLSACPELHSHPIREQDEFVILGSDGLWGAVDSADAVRLARSELAAYDGDASMASEKLVEVALKRHADDNVSAMIVCLNLKVREVEIPRRPRLMLARRSSAAGQATPSTAKSVGTASGAIATPSDLP